MIAFTTVQATKGIFSRMLRGVEKKKLPLRVEIQEKRKQLNVIEELIQLLESDGAKKKLKEFWQMEWEKTNEVERKLNLAQFQDQMNNRKRLK